MFRTAIAFISRNLLPILIFAIAGVIWWQITSIIDERDEALRDLNNLQHAFDIAKAENAGKLAALKDEGIRNQAKQKQQHIADIQHIGKLYGKVINNEKDAITYRNAVINKLRQQQAASSANGVPKDDASGLAGDDSNSASIRLGEESPEFYRRAYHGAQQYIETLTQAGAVCASDYNACKSYVDSEQGRIGIYAE
jgi:hypothetical protein